MNKTLWLQTVVPWQVARLGVDICHFTNQVGPLWIPCPMILTIHDMSLWLFPEYHHYRRLLAMRPLIPLVAHRAAAIITISHSAKQDIVRILGIPAHKIHVIYEAPASCFKLLTAGPALDSIRESYRLPERFLLCVGTIEPRKNLVRLLEAFAQLRRSDARFRTYVLIFVGQRGWKDEAVFAAVERLGLSQVVSFLGHVPTNVLVGLYNLADALAFPSLYEGFGLPVIEAMACGTPVITSRNNALAEIAGDAAELVDPTHSGDIFEGLRRVLTDSARQEELRTQGFVRAAQFSWLTAATQTRELYTQIVS
jgi:glycosyltransferase involved in cell wall biosynthesis